MNEHEPNIEDELDAALASFDKDPLPTTASQAGAAPSAPATTSAEAAPTAHAPESALPSTPEGDSMGSPTLDALAPSRRPKDPTVCTHCPNSVWFSTPDEVKCYCRVMYLVTWSNKEPQRMTNCDGLYIGQEA